MYTSLVYNINVATSVTSQGRASVSTMTMFFESFLANNVKFGSVNEVLSFINNVKGERKNRKYRDELILDSNISVVDCFAKVILSCGYRWIPDENELNIIWTAIENLSQEDINRVYYKNNLYEFMNNASMKRSIECIMSNLNEPFLDPNNPPKSVRPMLDELVLMLKEYVYYRYMYIDRIDRCANMIRSVTLESDTDSTIVSFDAWYRYILDDIKDLDFPIRKVAEKPIYEVEMDEFGDITDKRFKAMEKLEEQYDYNFFSDELIELKHTIDPLVMLPQDNIRHSIINILGYVTGILCNDYMEKYCYNNNSFRDSKIRKCKIIAKNEFFQSNLVRLEKTQRGNLYRDGKPILATYLIAGNIR